MLAKVIKFLKEVRQELSKVSWPRRDELWASTGIVIAVSAIFALLLFVMDKIFSTMVLSIFR